MEEAAKTATQQGKNKAIKRKMLYGATQVWDNPWKACERKRFSQGTKSS